MRSTLALAFLVLALLPATAAAEPQHRVTLGPASGEAKWDATGSGTLYLQDILDAVGCRPGIHECYDTLVELKGPGKLQVNTSCDDPKTQDVDLQIFDSDASGKVGKELQESAATGLDCNESVTVQARAPHFYIVRVDYAVAVQGVAHVLAKFTGVAPSQVIAPRDLSPTVTISKFSTKKVKAFKGTAGDDKGIAKVEVGLLRVSRYKCEQLTSTKGTFKKAACDRPTKWVVAKGTTAWSLKMKKALKKGSYELFVRSIDTGGHNSVVAKRLFKAR